jgi:coenzyme F420 hydrogenase subunit beta
MTSNINITVKNNLCTGCGICQDACHSGAISIVVKNGEFRPQINSSLCKNNNGCHRCYDSCPGIGVNLNNFAQELFKSEVTQKNKYIGNFLNCYAGHSNDKELRYHAASGGVLSQFLVWLIEKGEIDGAVVTKFNKDNPLKVKTFIAKTKEEIIESKGSKYSPTTLANIIKQIKKEKGNRFVLVGVPCQIEGLRKLMLKDKALQSKICGLFSLYCSGTRTFNFTEYVLKERHINIDDLNYLAYRDNGCLGGLVAKGNNIDYYEDYQSYCHPLRSVFYPHRCILCADHFGELSDISFGDIHIKPYSDDKIGVNSIITRTKFWDNLLQKSKNEGAITLYGLDPNLLLSSQKMAKIKKDRNISFCLFEKRIGKNVPDYGTNYGTHLTVKKIIAYIQIRIQQFICKHKKLWCLIPLLKAKVKIE